MNRLNVQPTEYNQGVERKKGNSKSSETTDTQVIGNENEKDCKLNTILEISSIKRQYKRPGHKDNLHKTSTQIDKKFMYLYTVPI